MRMHKLICAFVVLYSHMVWTGFLMSRDEVAHLFWTHSFRPDQASEILCDYIYQMGVGRYIPLHTVAYDCSNHLTNVSCLHLFDLSHHMTTPTKWPVCPVQTRISLGIHPVWSESLLSVWRNLGFLATKWAHSEDSDQTGRMPRLICIFAVHTGHLVGFVMLGSFVHFITHCLGPNKKYVWFW